MTHRRPFPTTQRTFGVALFLAALSQTAFYWAISRSFIGPTPPQPSEPPPISLAPSPLHLAGSGSCLPLFRQIRQRIALPFVLHPSIGSTGGVHALHEKAIHLALLSRPPSAHERHPSIQFVTYAETPVVIAAHPSVPLRDITTAQLFDLYSGKRRIWPNRLPVVVFQRERGDSSHEAIYQHLPAFRRINEQAYATQRWRVLYRDSQMQRMLLQTIGSIGIFDLGSIQSQRLPLRVLNYNGIPPTLQKIQQKRYPFKKPVVLASHTSPNPLIQRLLHDLMHPSLDAFLQQQGYLRPSISLSPTTPSRPIHTPPENPSPTSLPTLPFPASRPVPVFRPSPLREHTP